MKKIFPIICFTLLLSSQNSFAASLDQEIDGQIGNLLATYKDIHQHPELSMMEKNTSAKLAKGLKKLGFDVTDNFGGYGVVGIFKNGDGPKILIRTDMDALPIKEDTGLEYASTVMMKDRNGEQMPAMHACGHDMHMTVWLGVAKTLVDEKDQWHGTIMMVGQQAEEIGRGAKSLLDNELYKKFFKPDYALALHVNPQIASGQIGYRSGFVMAGTDTVDIDVYGIGGHGAMPQKTIDPIVLSSRIILDLQTIISRNISPLDSAVITVGAINGGTQNNIIPDVVKLKLTIRSYKEEVRNTIFSGLERITRGDSIAAGLSPDKYPKIIKDRDPVPALYNSPILEAKLRASFAKSVGENNIVDFEPAMTGEDFSRYAQDNVPVAMFRLGIGDPKEVAAGGAKTPNLHSANMKPYNPEEAIKIGVKTMSNAVMDLMNSGN